MARPSVLSDEYPQRVDGLVQPFLVGLEADAGIDVVLEWGEPAGIDGIDGGVLTVGGIEHFPHVPQHVRLVEEVDGIARRRGRIVPVGVADARVGGDGIVQLRRERAGETLADENDRLPPFAQSPQFDRGALQRAHRDVVPNLLDGRGGIVGVLLLEHVARLVVELPAQEVLDGADERPSIPREVKLGDRSERIHQRDHVQRGELILDEFDDRFSDRQVIAPLDVVVVEEQHEQPHVGTRRFALLVREAADLRRRPRVELCVGVDLDHGELFDLLRLVVLGQREFFGLQVQDGIPLPVGHDRIDADVVDAGADWALLRALRLCRLRRRRGGSSRRLRLRRLRRLLGLTREGRRAEKHHQQRDRERGGDTHRR